MTKEDEQQRTGELREPDHRPVGAEEWQVIYAITGVNPGHQISSGYDELRKFATTGPRLSYSNLAKMPIAAPGGTPPTENSTLASARPPDITPDECVPLVTESTDTLGATVESLLKGLWVVEGNWKLLIPHEANVKGGKVELYDLSKDPTESKNLPADHPDRLADLKKKLDAWWKPE